MFGLDPDSLGLVALSQLSLGHKRLMADEKDRERAW